MVEEEEDSTEVMEDGNLVEDKVWRIINGQRMRSTMQELDIKIIEEGDPLERGSEEEQSTNQVSNVIDFISTNITKHIVGQRYLK